MTAEAAAGSRLRATERLTPFIRWASGLAAGSVLDPDRPSTFLRRPNDEHDRGVEGRHHETVEEDTEHGRRAAGDRCANTRTPACATPALALAAENGADDVAFSAAKHEIAALEHKLERQALARIEQERQAGLEAQRRADAERQRRVKAYQDACASLSPPPQRYA
jgi:hypothetical protein